MASSWGWGDLNAPAGPTPAERFEEPPKPLPGEVHDPFAGMSEEEAKQALRDPYWRLCNLYWIKNKDGKTVLFKPNAVQKKFIEELWYRNVVPKARQRGFSTVVQLMILDACLFVENTNAAIIAQDEQAAKSIRNDKIIFAYDRMPETIRKAVPLVVKNITELAWANGSNLQVANSTRSMTLQWLHVSEHGVICLKNPEKAAEIQSGSLPSVGPYGIAVIESTVEGTEGDFADKVRLAQATQQTGRTLSHLDYRLHFASWWDADEYEVDPDTVTISPKDNAYFHKMEGLIGQVLSPRKRAWYVATRDITFGGNDEKMHAQYPTTLEEAFSVSMEGVWLSNQLVIARREQRITRVPYDPLLPVNTFWDIGLDDDIAIWFHQQVGARNHFIDYFEINNVPYSPVAKELKSKPYVYGKHYLPHDASHRRPGEEVLKTVQDMLESLGVKPTDIVPRISELIIGINQLREAFNTYWFDQEKCKEGLAHLGGYQKVWNKTHGRFIDEELKNGHDHAAAAIRQHAQYRHVVRQGGLAGPGKLKRNRSAAAI